MGSSVGAPQAHSPAIILPAPPAINPSRLSTVSVSSSSIVLCFVCGEEGHQRAVRQHMQKYSLIMDDWETTLYDGPPVFDVKSSTLLPEEHVDGDVGLVLVIRCSCLTPKGQPGSDLQHHHIFKSSCTIGGKVCRYIIDSSSCGNVMYVDVMHKFPLSIEPHPFPYTFAWIQRGSFVTVDCRVSVNFSIGAKYKDVIWCDVVPMDAYHLFLGRSWQYDRPVVHDGHRNTYIFVY